MADGGEGTAQVVYAALGGQWIDADVEDAYGRPVKAALLRLPDDTYLVEAAAGPGFVLPDQRLKPGWEATSRGLGQLMQAAVRAGARKLVVTLGGTGSSDGGMGLMEILGGSWANPVRPATTALGETGPVVLPRLSVPVEVWCDVDSPLTGPSGAIQRFGPQKGLPTDRLSEWDAMMAQWGERLRQASGREIATVPGAGAAGGLGAALLALGAVMRSGGEAVADMVGLSDALAQNDLVVTGEGAIDAQSAGGKVVGTVVRRAAQLGRPAIALVGTVGAGADLLYQCGLTGLFVAALRPMPVNEALASAAVSIEEASYHLGYWLRSFDNKRTTAIDGGG